MPNKRAAVRIPAFNYTVHVVFARSVGATAKRLGSDLTGCHAGMITRDNKGNAAWIIFPEDPDENVIAHEACHAVREMLRNAGARLDEETFAYHLGFLVGRIHKSKRNA